ncbi:hypothetical protein NL476_28430, partial [Klebsiella pneumoniae]|nr:hypothetical protein [Klebsiella pneumoniae]
LSFPTLDVSSVAVATARRLKYELDSDVLRSRIRPSIASTASTIFSAATSVSYKSDDGVVHEW